MCTNGTRDRVSIALLSTLDLYHTAIDIPSVRGRHTIETHAVDGSSIVGKQKSNLNFRRHAIELRSILVVITRSMMVDESISTYLSAVSDI